ncbi:MAG: YfbU family protein [Terriglobia bacterium]|jgi:hypothetical protein
MQPKSLTPVERLQLVNQFRILEKLYPEQAADYEEWRGIIARGYTIQYGDVFNEVWEEMEFADCEYVYEVLNLYRILIQSYDALTDKKGLKPEDVRFQGFDLNNESKHFSFAEHLRKQGKWTETLTGNLNSHSMTTMSLYPRMLKKFEPIQKQLMASHASPWLLTAEQIKEIIS